VVAQGVVDAVLEYVGASRVSTKNRKNR